jgi:hypothetical protein
LLQMVSTMLYRGKQSDEALFLSLQATSRLLVVYPYILDTFLSNIEPSHSIFELATRTFQETGHTGDFSFSRIHVLRIAIQLLHQSSGRILEVWEWSPLVQLFEDRCDEVRSEVASLMGAVLSLSPYQISSMVSSTTGQNEDVGILDCESHPLLDGDSEDAHESARLFVRSVQGIITDSKRNETDCNLNLSFSSLQNGQQEVKRLTESFGLLFSDLKSREIDGHGSKAFVHTDTTCRNLMSAVIALCQKRAVLLEGPSGCGKTALVEYVADLSGNSKSMIRVHLDDQMDSKTLIGSYVCTETPGEFVWKAGALTQAVEQVRRRPAATPRSHAPQPRTPRSIKSILRWDRVSRGVLHVTHMRVRVVYRELRLRGLRRNGAT